MSLLTSGPRSARSSIRQPGPQLLKGVLHSLPSLVEGEHAMVRTSTTSGHRPLPVRCAVRGSSPSTPPSKECYRGLRETLEVPSGGTCPTRLLTPFPSVGRRTVQGDMYRRTKAAVLRRHTAVKLGEADRARLTAPAVRRPALILFQALQATTGRTGSAGGHAKCPPERTCSRSLDHFDARDRRMRSGLAAPVRLDVEVVLCGRGCVRCRRVR